MKKISHSYFVVMIDHGQRGLEAIVHPENTRRKVVEMIASGELKDIAFIHHVDGMYIYDCTSELIAEASAPFDVMATIDPDFSDTFAADRIAFNRDHAYDLRKHGETV